MQGILIDGNDGNSLKAGSSLMQSSQSWTVKKIVTGSVSTNHKCHTALCKGTITLLQRNTTLPEGLTWMPEKLLFFFKSSLSQIRRNTTRAQAPEALQAGGWRTNTAGGRPTGRRRLCTFMASWNSSSLV